MGTKKNSEALRRERVRQLFVARHPGKRTANDILNFSLWLQKHNPDLLPKQGNAYHHLKVDLDGLFLHE